MLLSENGRLCTVTFKFGAVILIQRHHTNDTRMGYLNIYVQHEDGFSKMTRGLIGMLIKDKCDAFYNKIQNIMIIGILHI
jgi:hypothetical protein